MSINKIFTDGNLVDINVSMWTAERKLQPEDLGLDGQKISEAFTLGHKKLIPGDVIAKFKHYDYLARNTLMKYGYQFPFGSARFIPKKRFLEFVTELDPIIDLFNKAADDLAKNYGKYRLQMRQQFVEAAHGAYTRAKTLCGFDVPQDKFVNEFLARVDRFYPKAADIRSKFAMDYSVFQMALPDLSQASYEDLAEEQEKINLLQAAYQKSLTRKIESFVNSIVDGQRKKAQEVLQRFSDNIQQNKKISEASMSSVRTMIEEYERMDIINDEAFLGLLKNFKQRLIDTYTAKDVRESKALQSSIVDELSVLISAASDRAMIDALAQGYRERIQL
jgi:hypothetical protein